jgi:hypothetical protein
VPQRKCGKSFGAALPIAAPTSYNMWTQPVGNDPMGLPQTARKLAIMLDVGLLTGGDLSVAIGDDWAENAVGQIGMGIANTAAGTHVIGQSAEVMVSTTGTLKINYGIIQGASADAARLVVRAYQDGVLAQR